METLIGDVLLSGAFLAYAGYFDQQLRDTLFSTWSSHLVQVNTQHTFIPTFIVKVCASAYLTRNLPYLPSFRVPLLALKNVVLVLTNCLYFINCNTYHPGWNNIPTRPGQNRVPLQR